MEYKTTIGLEIHVQLKTKSKMFCSCGNDAQNALPNTLVCPVCLGLPGTLPVPNAQAIEWTLKTALALKAEIPSSSKFDRKHYFYPDLPKNYQISQYDQPFALKGYLEIEDEEGNHQKINLTRIHLEEDAGKLIHTSDATLIDLNRAGTPLMEIVTEPEISSSCQAKNFMQELRTLLRFLDVSDADMEKGHLRCDANISLCEIKNQKSKIKMGIPVEIKNLNSFKMVEKALLYEQKRQQVLLEKGEKVVKETRGWNDQKNETYSQRSKEMAQDYRYFPEPDIPLFDLTQFNLDQISRQIPELPAQKRKRYLEELNLSANDATTLSSSLTQANYFEKVSAKINPKLAANWIINELGSNINKVDYEDLIELLQKVEQNQIIANVAKQILQKIIQGQKITEIIGQEGGQLPSEEIEKFVEQVIDQNRKAVDDFHKGKESSRQFLFGQVMRLTKGQADPKIINQILAEKLK